MNLENIKLGEIKKLLINFVGRDDRFRNKLALIIIAFLKAKKLNISAIARNINGMPFDTAEKMIHRFFKRI